MAVTSTSIRRSIPRRRRWLGLLGATLVTLTLTAGSASATIVQRDRVLNSPYELDNWDCGYRLHISGVETHFMHLRADSRNADNFFFTDNYARQETWTAPDGRWFTVTANGIFKDVQAHHVNGTLWSFAFHENGQPFVIKDSSGTVVSRDRGNLTGRYTFDFDDQSFNFLGFTLHGPHPTFNVDLCPIIQPLTGTDSAKYLTERPIGSTPFPNGYDEYLPPSYSPTGPKSPLLLFFNGYGENGDGTPAAIDRLVGAGIPRYISIGGWDTNQPFVVLAMQHVEDAPGFDGSACEDATWVGSCNMFSQHALGNVQPAFCTTPFEVHDFIDYAIANYNVDPARVYITGLSCGAFGVWEYLGTFAGSIKAAAAVPIAGEGRPAWATAGCGLAETPMWAFHGSLDDTVEPAGSIDTMHNLQACPLVDPNKAKLTVFPDRDHNSWDPAYGGADGSIYDWMLTFTKP
jgi:hypothetical protein